MAVADRMRKLVSAPVKRAVGAMGYEIRRVPDPTSEPIPMGQDPYADIRSILDGVRSPTVFDVGANVGQTIEQLHRYLGSPSIHAFEPGPDTFRTLSDRKGGTPGLRLNNLALGAQSGSMEFFESSVGSELSSLLKPSVEIWGGGGLKGSTVVQVSTVDEYCATHDVAHIDLLKTDTQGYDFEVVKGATDVLGRTGIHLVLMEVLFSDMYHGQPRADDVFEFMFDHGFVLVSFYPFSYWETKASWADAVFMHPGFRRSSDG